MMSWRQRGSGEEPQNPSNTKAIFRGQPSTKRESAPETLERQRQPGDTNKQQR